MKSTSTRRIILLITLLLIIIMFSVILLISLFKNDLQNHISDTTVSEKSDDMTYVESLLTDSAFGGMGPIFRYNGVLATKENESIIDISSQRSICKIPLEWFKNYSPGIADFDIDQNGNLYTVYYSSEKGLIAIGHSYDTTSADTEVSLNGCSEAIFADSEASRKILCKRVFLTGKKHVKTVASSCEAG